MEYPLSREGGSDETNIKQDIFYNPHFTGHDGETFCLITNCLCTTDMAILCRVDSSNNRFVETMAIGLSP